MYSALLTSKKKGESYVVTSYDDKIDHLVYNIRTLLGYKRMKTHCSLNSSVLPTSSFCTYTVTYPICFVITVKRRRKERERRLSFFL